MKRFYEVVFSRSYEIDIEDYVPIEHVMQKTLIKQAKEFAKYEFSNEFEWLSPDLDDFSAKVYLVEDSKRTLVYPKE